MRQKLSIEEVTNGYIVRVRRTGVSVYKEPFENPVLVFETFEALSNYLQCLKPSSAEEHRKDNRE